MTELLHQTVLGVQWLCRVLVGCRHTRATFAEGKTYCPDCCQGIVFVWKRLRCQSCQLVRQGHYCLGQVVAVDRCCRRCGSEAIRTESIQEPSYYQMSQSLLVVELEVEHLAARLTEDPWLSRVQVWLEPKPWHELGRLLPVASCRV